MKKLISFILLLLLVLPMSLVSCKKDDDSDKTDDTTVRVGVLSGTTGLGIAKLYSDTDALKNKNYEIEIFNDVTVITAKLAAGELDIAAMPTSDAAVYYGNDSYQNNNPIQMLALNTLSVLYGVTSMEGINSLSDLKGKEVYLPTPEGQGPDVIFRALLSKNGIGIGDGAEEVKIINTANPQALIPLVAVKGKAKIAILPEPLRTNATAKAKQNNITLKTFLNVGEVWGSENPIVQGCLVVRKNFADEHSGRIDAFLADYNASVEYMTNPDNLDGAAKTVASISDFGLAEGVVKTALPNCNIVCITGADMKTKLDEYYKTIYNINKNALGNKGVPDDAFYYA